MFTFRSTLIGLFLGLSTMLLASSPARAQSTTRDRGWDDATTGLSVAAGLTSVLMPRVFYSSPEATVGWRARFHVSVLAPVMTQATIALLNEVALKAAFKDPRPGCGAGLGAQGCETFGLLSTQIYSTSAALGQGVSVFVMDTLRHSDSRLSAGALVGHIIVPLALAGVTVGGRLAGNLESPEQVLGSVGIGLLSGLAFGALYSTMQLPSCGYTGDMICW